jgi:hypothetical protein
MLSIGMTKPRFSGFRLQAGFQRAELRSGTISSQKGIARLPQLILSGGQASLTSFARNDCFSN